MPRRHEMKMENTIAAWTAEPQFSAAAPPSARRGSGTYKENTSVAKDRLLIGLGRWPKPLCCVSSLSTYPAGPTALVGWLPGRSWRLLVSDLRESGKEGKRERGKETSDRAGRITGAGSRALRHTKSLRPRMIWRVLVSSSRASRALHPS
ncbi:unnamed protein product [Diplocarpon coronariae]